MMTTHNCNNHDNNDDGHDDGHDDSEPAELAGIVICVFFFFPSRRNVNQGITRRCDCFWGLFFLWW